jgi:hypothetical protein
MDFFRGWNFTRERRRIYRYRASGEGEMSISAKSVKSVMSAMSVIPLSIKNDQPSVKKASGARVRGARV